MLQQGTKEAAENNQQPHIVCFRGTDDQYYISIERTALFECRDLPTAVLLVLASHYVFNLAYTAKAANFYRFIQEKILGVPSDDKMKSPVAISHFNGINRKFTSLLMEEGDETVDEVVAL